jgi:hypothetical protein
LTGAALIAAYAVPATAQANLPWATLTIKPSRGENETRIEFGTTRLNSDTRQLEYWMRRQQNGMVQRANSNSCPGMRAVIGEMKHIEPMQPDPPGFRDKDIVLTADGTWHILEGPGTFQDGHMGKFRMEANVNTPLAAWARRVTEVLEHCWK